ncbi:MAG: ATP-binding protein, partial [Candidatus Thermoplasmatota archaeon]|nr:ATP-binding protein [Candidatus Thermoplasmatota archaeon]
AIYEGILRAVANGKVVSGEISSYLFSKKLIEKNDPSMIQQYLKNLIGVGIIKKIVVFGKKKFVYKHVSVLAKLFYYADEKYNISERKPDEKEMERIIDEIMPKIVEDNIREFFADKFGLKETVVEAKDYDVDACLLKFKKPEMVVEVKWKENVSKEDITKAEKNLGKIDAKKKILFVPDKKMLHSSILDIVDISDFIEK